MFKYIADCRALGCSELDLWNGHLPSLLDAEAGPPRTTAAEAALLPAEVEYLDHIRAAADAAGLSFGCLAIDGAHIYEATLEGRQVQKINGQRWLNIAARLGARQARIDSGGPADMPPGVLAEIVAGYRALMEYASARGIEVLMENHWGASRVPENVVQILQAVPGLGLLFDTGNWPAGRHAEAWALCAPFARATHVKTRAFDAQGNETTWDVPRAVQSLLDAGYQGCWGIESVPAEGDEFAAAQQSLALVRRLVSPASAASAPAA